MRPGLRRTTSCAALVWLSGCTGAEAPLSQGGGEAGTRVQDDQDTDENDDENDDTSDDTSDDTVQDAGASAQGALGGECTVLRREALGQVDEASDARVVVVEEDADIRTLYVDASAGGFQGAASHPYVYVNLDTAEALAISDFDADESSRWDLAFKRFTVRTNSSDSGPGQGGAATYAADFDEVTRAAVDPKDLLVDDFIDDETCESVAGDPGIGGIWTAFAGWYAYDDSNMTLSPNDYVHVVRGADGTSLYKLQILDYYGTEDGGQGPVSGRYLIRYAAL